MLAHPLVGNQLLGLREVLGGERKSVLRAADEFSDIAHVLLNNDHGDATAAAERVLEVFGPPTGEIRTQLLDLQAISLIRPPRAARRTSNN